MPIFTLTFEGLICHVGPSATEKTRSVLVWSPSSEPEDNHIPKITANGIDHVLRQHDSITFRNLPTGHPGTEFDFRIRVPTLERLLNPPGGTIKGTVLNGDPDPAVAATIELPFGSLSAPLPHETRINFMFFNGDTESRCVPTQTLLIAVTSASHVEIVIAHRDATGAPDGKPTVLIVPSDSVVQITNLPIEAGGNHFRHFLHLTTGEDMAWVTSDGTPCGGAGAPRAALRAKDTKKAAAYAKLIETFPSAKVQIAQETASRAQGKEVGMTVTSNPECTNSGWP
jgi:hypothetical protein